MNPFRLFNPFYVLKLEREMVGLIIKAGRLSDSVDAEVALRRGYLERIATLMASGRTQDAKTLVDVLMSVLEDEAA